MKNNKDRSSYTYKKTAADTQDGSVIKIYVFKGDEYIGWDCFGKTRVYIGKSKDADLLLDASEVLDTQAILSINGHMMTIFAQDKGCGVRVNGSLVTTCTLEPFDFITIGPYTLKIKLQKIKEQQEFERGRINSLLDPGPVNPDISSFKAEETSEEISEETGNADTEVDVIDVVSSSAFQLLLDGPNDSEVTQKTEITSENVSENSLENSSENSDISDNIEVVESEAQETILLLSAPETATKYQEDSISIGDDYKEPLFQFYSEDLDDEDEEDEDEDLAGLFSLKDELFRETILDRQQGERVLEIVKSRHDSIFDIQFLGKNDKYYITTNNRKRFCIAENRNSEEYYCFFNKEQFSGKVLGRNSLDISNLCDHENLYNKRKNIYRYLIPSENDTVAAVVLNDGYYEYSLRRVDRSKTPEISTPPKEKNPYYKHLARSGVFHLIVLFVAGLFFSISPPPEPEEPESRFVKIDTRQILDSKKKVIPVKKKPKLQMANKPAKKTFKKAFKKTFKKRASSKVKTTRKKTVSRSPKAGGGSKNGGNVVNRNVNVKEAGILSVLGISDGFGIGAKDALAAVTNLDAVRSPASNQAKLKVAGLVGKLGGSKIAVPSVGLINTKGSTAVIRSAGIEGNGTIAALEKGKTGQNQVMAMVSADLSKTVRIQGGMSREAVKKVIDQHMDVK